MEAIIFMTLFAIVGLFFLKQGQEYTYDKDPKVSDYLPWGYLVEDGIIFNKNGSLQKSFKIQGQDRKSMEDIDMIDLRSKLNNILRRMDGNWSIHLESRRIKAKPYTPSYFKEVTLQLIDKIRCKNYNSGKFFITEYYLTLIWFPPIDLVNKMQDKLIIDEENKEISSISYLKDFKQSIKEYSLMMKKHFIIFTPLNDEETLTFLHSAFSQNSTQKVAVQRKEIFLDAFISDTPITDGLPPKVGDEYLGVISLLSFPSETFFSMFHELDELGIEYRWTSRFIFQNKEDSITAMTKAKGKWASKRKGILDAIEDKITKDDRTTNFEAEMRENEAVTILRDLQDDVYLIGYYTFTILVKDKDIKSLNNKLDTILEIIQSKGFIAIKENIDLLQAFFGSMPGNIEHNVRKVPVPTLTAIDLLQFTSIYSGQQYNKHLDGVSHFLSNSSDGSTAIYFNLNVGDVGHTAIYGKTGSGKSVFLSFLAAQFKKYKDSQVFFFDKGGSSRVLTTAVRGKFNDLGNYNLTFQPLGNIGMNEINTDGLDEKEIAKAMQEERLRANNEKNWAFDWICDIYEQENLTLTPEFKEAIQNALDSLSNLPKSRRTMTQFSLALQKNELRIAIKPYTKDGAFGDYFDSDKDDFNTEFSWQVFEMDKVMENKLVAPPMIKYIFHKLDVEMFTKGKPTLLILDECWRLLDNEAFAQKLKQWLKELRKKKVYVVFATQEITDILNSSIKDTLINSCATTIYLPNKKATTSNFVDLYRGLGLNDKQITMISNLTPKQDYYCVSTLGNLDVKPNFSEFEISLFGASSTEEQKKCIEIENELISQGYKGVKFEEEFIKKWIDFKNIKMELDF